MKISEEGPVIAVSGLLLLVIFVLDMISWKDTSFLIIYLFPIFIVYWKTSGGTLRIIALFTSLAIVSGGFWPKSSLPTFDILFHSMFAVLIVLFIYLLMKQKESTEDSLRTANRLMEGILDNTHLYFAFMDTGFNFIKVNSRYAEIDEKDITYFKGKNHFDLYPNRENEEIFRQVVKTGTPYYTINRPFVFENNPERGITYWDWSLIPVKDKMGRIEGVLMSLANVTERNRAEMELKVQKQRAEILSEISVLLARMPLNESLLTDRITRKLVEIFNGGCIIELAGDNNRPETPAVIQSGNGAFREILRALYKNYPSHGGQSIGARVIQSGEPIIISSLQEEILKSDRPEYLLYYERLQIRSIYSLPLRTESKVIGSLTLLNNTDLSEQSVLDQAFMMQLADRITLAIINARLYQNSLNEIEERKKAEERIREQGALLKTIFDNIPAGIWVTNSRGEIIFGNPEAHKLWKGARYVGIDRFNEYVGWWVETGELIQPEEWAVVRAVRKGESSINEMIKIRCFDGTHKTILNSSVPVIDEKGNITGALIVNQDITESKINEERLRKTLVDLERSNKELEYYAYIASHDLQEPLRMVASFTQLLNIKYGKTLNEEAQKYIHFAVEGARRMHLLITDLLEYSKIANRQRKLEKVDVQEIIDSVIYSSGLQIQASKAHINYDNLPEITADPFLIKQLFYNLISNSIKFSGNCTPEIFIGGRELPDEWQFYVRDNGIGISSEYFDKIFIIFQRLHERDKYPGTGIGLTICKRIAELHNGRIWVESEEGKGSTFFFSIPKVN